MNFSLSTKFLIFYSIYLCIKVFLKCILLSICWAPWIWGLYLNPVLRYSSVSLKCFLHFIFCSLLPGPLLAGAWAMRPAFQAPRRAWRSWGENDLPSPTFWLQSLFPRCSVGQSSSEVCIPCAHIHGSYNSVSASWVSSFLPLLFGET